MAGKVVDRRVLSIRKCPFCAGDLERLEIAGDEKEVVIADVCWNCGFDYGERIERKRNIGGGDGSTPRMG